MKDGPLPKFADPEAGFERGFDINHHGIGLPGSTWAEGNMFDGRHFVPNCNMEDAVFTDQVWAMGRHDSLELGRSPEEAVLTELFFSNPSRRLQAIEQLTLPPIYSTIPNTGAFSRFEHVWGSALFVKKMAEKNGLGTAETVKLQLRTVVSDIAHTTGSHLGDWLFQFVGGDEDQHDKELATYLEATGINDMLQRYGVDPREILSPAAVDWVEAPAPDLCVDRVDYGVREINRWNDVAYWQNFSADDFVITPENMLAMTDQRRARIFSEAYLLLSEEHWSEPTHKFIEELLLLRTKLFYAEGLAPNTWVFKSDPRLGLVQLQDIHPRDLMYVTDPAQTQAFALPNLTGHTLDAIMRSVSQYHRQYVWPGRRERIASYMHQFAQPADYARIASSGEHKPIGSPDFHTYLDEYPQTLPNGFAILSPEEAEATKGPQDFDFVQVPFKLRQIDPLVQTVQGFQRLSELDSSFAHRLAEHKDRTEQTLVARLTISKPSTYKLLNEAIENVEAHWEERLKTSRRMTPDELNGLLEVAALEIHGSYPFMSFLSY